MSKSTVFQKLPLVIAIQLAVTHAPAMADPKDVQLKDIERIEVVGKYTVNENIDTATGLGLSLLETPQSVSIVTAQRIKDQNFSSINEVISQSIGLSAQQVDSTRNTFSARGFDIDKYQIDGVPLAWSLAGDSGETLADVALYERIEIVRGATGLLTGAGDPSASINLVRKRANSTELKGYLSGNIGSWNNRALTADVADSLIADGSIRARIVAKKERGDTFMEIPKEDKTVLYGVLEADISEQTSLSLGSSYQDNDPTGSTWGGLAAWFTDDTQTAWDRKVTSSANWTYWQSQNRNQFGTLTHTFGNNWQAKVSYNSVKNSADTKLLYVWGSLDKTTGEGLNPWPYKSAGFSRQSSVDFQLKGDFEFNAHQHEFVIGALQSRQRAETDTFAQTSPFVGIGNFFLWDGSYTEPTFANQGDRMEDVHTSQDGVYAATRLEISNNLKLIAGGRLSSWQRTGSSWGADQNYGDNSVFVPYVGVMYEINRAHSFYFSQTEIFKPQNARDVTGAFIEPVTGTNIEAGLKSSFVDGAVQTSIALFTVEQDNFAQNTYVPFPDKPVEMIYAAIDGTTSQGFELEVVGQVADYWNLSAGYSQFSAEDLFGVDVNTDHPKKKLNIFTTYELQSTLAGLVIGGGVSFEGEHYSGTGIRKLTQSSYALVNLMARYELMPQLSLQFNVDNLFDKTYFSQVGFFEQYGYGKPRSAKLGLTYNF